MEEQRLVGEGLSTRAHLATGGEWGEAVVRLVFVRDATSGVYERGLDELAGIGVAVVDAEECATWLEEVAAAAG